MNRKIAGALILIGLSVIVLLCNARGWRPSVDVNLLLGTVSGPRSLVFFAFLASGVLVK